MTREPDFTRAIGPSVAEEGLSLAALEEKVLSDAAALLDPDPDTNQSAFERLLAANPELATALARNLRQRLACAGVHAPPPPEHGELRSSPAADNRAAFRVFGEQP